MKNQKSRKILSVLLAVLMLLTALPMAASAADEISFETDEDGAYLINTVDDLINLGISVDAGTTYSKKTFKLTADLDLDGIDWDPIGSYYNAFEGNFYGQDHTILNLNITKLATYMGLFAKLGTPERSGVIKDLTIKNVTVIGGATYGAGALAGDAYVGTISNVRVIGKIAIEQGYYVGGIAGGMSYSRYENCLVDGSNDEGFDSYIRAFYPGGYTNYVGGICGLYAEGAKGIDNCTVQNITLQSDDGYGVGSIVGVLQYGTKITNCKVSNVNLVSLRVDDDVIDWVGTVAGKDHTSANQKLSQIINCEVDSYAAYVGGSTEPVEVPYVGTDHNETMHPGEYDANTLIGENVVYDANGKIVSGDFTLIGPNAESGFKALISADIELPEIVDGKITVVSPRVTAAIGDVGYESLQAAIDAASGATVIKLLNNFSDTVEIPADADITLDIAGGTFSGSITNNGTLTLADSTASGEYKIATLTNNGKVAIVSGKFTTGSEADESCKEYLAPCRSMKDDGSVVVEHVKSIVGGKEPTCVDEGYEGDIICACGETQENGKVLSALGHNFEEVEAVVPSCITKGHNAYWKCSTCDKVFKDSEGKTETTVEAETLEKTEHIWIINPAVEPGCETSGHTEGKKCINCGQYEGEVKEIAPLGHRFGEITVIVPATCSHDGIGERTCSVCGKTEQVVISADDSKHVDNNHNGICDECLAKVEVNCDCYCHKTSKLSKIIWKFMRFFWKLFGGNNLRYCECGRAHW